MNFGRNCIVLIRDSFRFQKACPSCCSKFNKSLVRTCDQCGKKYCLYCYDDFNTCHNCSVLAPGQSLTSEKLLTLEENDLREYIVKHSFIAKETCQLMNKEELVSFLAESHLQLSSSGVKGSFRSYVPSGETLYKPKFYTIESEPCDQTHHSSLFPKYSSKTIEKKSVEDIIDKKTHLVLDFLNDDEHLENLDQILEKFTDEEVASGFADEMLAKFDQSLSHIHNDIKIDSSSINKHEEGKSILEKIPVPAPRLSLLAKSHEQVHS